MTWFKKRKSIMGVKLSSKKKQRGQSSYNAKSSKSEYEKTLKLLKWGSMK